MIFSGVKHYSEGGVTAKSVCLGSVRKNNLQLQNVVLKPRVLSFPLSFKVEIVLSWNQQTNQHNILVNVLLFSRCVKTEGKAAGMVFCVALLVLKAWVGAGLQGCYLWFAGEPVSQSTLSGWRWVPHGRSQMRRYIADFLVTGTILAVLKQVTTASFQSNMLTMSVITSTCCWAHVCSTWYITYYIYDVSLPAVVTDSGRSTGGWVDCTAASAGDKSDCNKIVMWPQ